MEGKPRPPNCFLSGITATSLVPWHNITLWRQYEYPFLLLWRSPEILSDWHKIFVPAKWLIVLRSNLANFWKVISIGTKWLYVECNWCHPQFNQDWDNSTWAKRKIMISAIKWFILEISNSLASWNCPDITQTIVKPSQYHYHWQSVYCTVNMVTKFENLAIREVGRCGQGRGQGGLPSME